MNDNMYTSGDYFEKYPTWGVEDSQWKAQKIFKILRNNKIEPHTVCEVGCGAGEILNQLHRTMPENVSFVGYEISPQAFKLCQSRENSRLKFFLQNLNEKNEHYDLVMAIDVFEHIENYMDFLRKLRDRGTYKLFHIPLDISVLSIIRKNKLVQGRYGVGHINSFTKEIAIATLKDCGYEIIDYFFTAGSTELPAKRFRTWIANFPRRLISKFSKDVAARLFGGYSLMVLSK